MVGWNLDPENQIPLDGETGVRGYRLHAVEGNRRLVGNVEARVLVVPEILQLVSFGLAAFGDVGWSWGEPDGFWHLADAGVGLRIGITRASKNSLLRMDVARARCTPIRSGGPGGSCRSRRGRRSRTRPRGQWMPCSASQRSASIAALQPSPAAETACR